jgi:hypothetical protein
MNKLIKENGIVISILLSWLFINLLFLRFSKKSSYSKEIYPFIEFDPDNNIGLVETYDISEFLLYGFTPIIIFVVIKLIYFEKK